MLGEVYEKNLQTKEDVGKLCLPCLTEIVMSQNLTITGMSCKAMLFKRCPIGHCSNVVFL